MGGFAVVIDWDRPVDPHATDPMMALVPHRATGGTRTHVTPHAVLAEGRTTHQVDGGPWEVATLGPLAIVGDIRLFETGRLRAAAGGSAATDGLDDRHLLLAAFRRMGIDFLDAVDGDFAFVIWDDARREVLAVRDRFAVKPLFFHETATGIRLASEVKQLTTILSRRPRPDVASVAEFLDGRFEPARRTFIDGVNRVLPSELLRYTRASRQRSRYWSPSADEVRHHPADLPGNFRDHLVGALDRRLATSKSTLAHLSGGLDSSSIVAAAAAVVSNTGATFTTVSAVFDLPSIDESRWIDDTVAMHPFPHIDYRPEIPDIDAYVEDTRIVDGPLININRDMSHVPARLAAAQGADALLTGRGGDDISFQGTYFADLLRSLRLIRFGVDSLRWSRWTGQPTGGLVLRAVRRAAPDTVRRAAQWLPSQRRDDPTSSLVSPSLSDVGAPAHPPGSRALPSLTQQTIALEVQSPRMVALNELHAQTNARYGVDVTHPYLDRPLVEFVLSIRPLDLPYDGRTKTLVRQAFASELPRSVLARRSGTYADEYLALAFADQRRAFRERFTVVPSAAAEYIDRNAYATLIERFDQGETSQSDHHLLVRAWHLMQWLGTLETSDARRR